MSNMSFFSKVIVIVFLVNGFFVKASGQEVVKSNDSQQVSVEDFQAVLKTLDLEIHKIDLNFSKEKKYTIVLYKQEYEKRNRIKQEDIWGTTSPCFSAMVNGVRVDKVIEQARIISKNNTSEYILGIRVGDIEIPKYPIIIDSIYKNPYGCKPFKTKTDLSVGSTIPLLLIGSFWDSKSIDGTQTVKRFCWEDIALEPDFSNKAFDLMPNYFIIGLRIEEIK